MAKATAINSKPSFILELSCEEAEFIIDVMRKIGGNSKTSRRRHADNILKALRGAGASHTDARDSEGSIMFDTEEPA